MSKSNQNDHRLVEEFVACFGRWDEMIVGCDVENVSSELAVGPEDECGSRQWQPLRFDTLPAAMDALYAALPTRLPQLYERLILSYRWATVDLGRYNLLANPPGHELTRLFQQISLDPWLWQALLPAGYVQFGRGPGVDYDPVCFDLRNGLTDGDCRVVRVDHEKILCHDRVAVVEELAPTFRELVWQTIERAAQSVSGQGRSGRRGTEDRR